MLHFSIAGNVLGCSVWGRWDSDARLLMWIPTLLWWGACTTCVDGDSLWRLFLWSVATPDSSTLLAPAWHGEYTEVIKHTVATSHSYSETTSNPLLCSLFSSSLSSYTSFSLSLPLPQRGAQTWSDILCPRRSPHLLLPPLSSYGKDGLLWAQAQKHSQPPSLCHHIMEGPWPQVWSSLLYC